MKELVVLENDTVRVVISPTVGASIYKMQYNLAGHWIDIMRETPPEALEQRLAGLFSSFTMMPYSNRVQAGLLQFGGKQYQLEINNEDGHTIHGDVRTRAWNVEEQRTDTLRLSFDSRDFTDVNWPFSFAGKMEFTISDGKLTTHMELINTGITPMPAGMGIHPYFMRKLSTQEERVVVCIPTTGVYPGDTPIPTGGWEPVDTAHDFSEERELTPAFLDTCFRVAHKQASIKWMESNVTLIMDWDPIFEHVIIFCPQDKPGYFAVEPVTNCNNGFNLANQEIEDTGTVVLQPGQSLAGDIVMTLFVP